MTRADVDFRQMIAQIIDETTARHGREAKYDDYAAVARDLFPTEMKRLGDSFSRSGFIKWLKDGMRRAVNLDESFEDAPQVQIDLPGLAAPAYINVGSNNTPQLVRFSEATVDDISIAIEHRNHALSRISARNEDLIQKREWLLAHRVHANETFGQAGARLGIRMQERPKGVSDEARTA